MTGIEPTAQLSALIRTALRGGAGSASLSQRSATGPKGLQSPTDEVSSGHILPGPDAAAVGGLDRQLLERIQQIPVHDPLRRKKAFVLFLESILAREFNASPGKQLDVAQLAGEAANRMYMDEELASQIEDAGTLLLELAGN